ncbi:MAG: hypothetical protein EHM58_10955 [Ignavibacteriae bacterium]|nr:MAG: hypothetical protein EHM58_10955 [Ignavibacteriota bacterium]
MPTIFNYIIVLIIGITFLSCSKDSDKQSQRNMDEDEIENPADTTLTPEEMFSTSILIDYLNDSDDEDLADYLETEIYKTGLDFSGISVVEATPSTWLVMMEKDSVTKNYLLQKFLNVKTNENYFRMKETQLTLTDIISKEKIKSSAGEQKEDKK